MLSIYNSYDDIFEYIPFFQVPLRHLASELFDEFGIRDEEELDNNLKKAFEVCCTLHIPIKEHFKKVYLYAQGQIHTDWLLSDMASYLLLLNGNTRNHVVAKAQMYLVNKKHI